MANTDYKSIDEYLKTHPKEVQDILQKVRTLIQKTVPNATEAISYQIPAFKLNGKNLIHFAGWKEHISCYPVPNGSAAFNKKIAPYVAGRGTVKFLLKNPIPYDLIEEIVKYRLKAHTAQKS
jgi:uncharacterized protein YdhG (YjbR/CyaY superfamily)